MTAHLFFNRWQLHIVLIPYSQAFMPADRDIKLLTTKRLLNSAFKIFSLVATGISCDKYISSCTKWIFSV